MDLKEFKKIQQIKSIYNYLIRGPFLYEVELLKREKKIDSYFLALHKRYGDKGFSEIETNIKALNQDKTNLLKELLARDVKVYETTKKINPIRNNINKLKKGIPIDFIQVKKTNSGACPETYYGFYRALISGTLTTKKIKIRTPDNKIITLRLLGKGKHGSKIIDKVGYIGINKLLLDPFSKNLDVYTYRLVNNKIVNLEKKYDLKVLKKELSTIKNVKRLNKKDAIRNSKQFIPELLKKIDEFYTKDGVSGIERMKKFRKIIDARKKEKIKEEKRKEKAKKKKKFPILHRLKK